MQGTEIREPMLPTAVGLTMSSLEIAGLTGKRHDHVLRDADKMLRELGHAGPSFGASYKDATGRGVRCLNLPKRECLILVSGYSVELRARIIDRWMELEAALHAGAGGAAIIDADLAEKVRRIDGIARMLSHKVTEIEKVVHPVAIAGHIAQRSLTIVEGLTAGEVCVLANAATKYPRGISGRVSKRLKEFCTAHGTIPLVQRMGRSHARLFPTHMVREWLEIEGRALIRRWLEEKSGQLALRLVK